MITMSKKLDSLMKELKAAHSETYFHSIRVKSLTCDFLSMARDLDIVKYTPEEVDAICKGALLHDIGKLYVKNVVLTKNDRLSDEEKKIIYQHTAKGFDAIKDELKPEEYKIVTDICVFHHERIDGSGYNGETEIPLYVQIVSLCDAFEALYSDRVYRKGLGIETSLEIIRKGKCGKFDSVLIDCLAKAVDKREIIE